MLIYLREARAQESRQYGTLASLNRASVAAAVVNTVAGKDTPDFDEMVERLMDGDDAEPKGLPGMEDIGGPGFTQPPSIVEGFKEF